MDIPIDVLSGTMEDYIGFINENSNIDNYNKYAIPEKQLYLIDNYQHTVNTIKLFNLIDSRYKSIAAENIVESMNRFNIPVSVIGKNNKLRSYIAINEASGPGNPVVGISSRPITNNMMNNVFATGSTFDNDVNVIRRCMKSTVKSLKRKNKYFVPYIPYITESYNINPNIEYCKDMDGVFVRNINTGLRSPSYKEVDDIDETTITYVTYGHLNYDIINDF